MSGRTIVIVLVIAAALFGGMLAMHGHGHRALARWLPAIHGGH
jgi:hypothetical protein